MPTAEGTVSHWVRGAGQKGMALAALYTLGGLYWALTGWHVPLDLHARRKQAAAHPEHWEKPSAATSPSL